LASSLFGGRDPLGQDIKCGRIWYRVIGVTTTIRSAVFLPTPEICESTFTSPFATAPRIAAREVVGDEDQRATPGRDDVEHMAGQHFAEVSGQAFIDPKQFRLHRLVEVGRVHVRRTTVLAVPGVNHFMREQADTELAQVVIEEQAFGLAIIARFVMFESEMSDVIAQGIEKIR
jgi:hypothetical protein